MYSKYYTQNSKYVNTYQAKYLLIFVIFPTLASLVHFRHRGISYYSQPRNHKHYDHPHSL